MKIAICDDCKADVKYLRELIKDSEFYSKSLELFEYSSGEELLENYSDFDAVFLDMQMGGMDGNETAERIRKDDSEVIISFYSGFEVAAHKVLHSQPYRYLIKGSEKERLSLDIDMVLKKVMEKKRKRQLEVKYRGETVLLKLSDILYITINGKSSQIWITDKKATEIWGAKDKPQELAIKSGTNLRTYYQQLKDYGFIHASKSYIVNAENVVAQSPCNVTLKGGYKLSLTRGEKKTFEEEFGKYWSLGYKGERGK